MVNHKEDKLLNLDTEHKLKIKELTMDKKELKSQKIYIQKLIVEFDKLNVKPSIELKDFELEKKLNLKEEIQNLTLKINNIEKNKNINNYLLNTTHILYNYYDKKNSQSIIDFFNLKKDLTINDDKNKIKNEYLKKINKMCNKNIEKTNFKEEFMCKKCSIEKICIQSESIKVCPNCGLQEKILIDSDKISYKEPPREISYFAYKRINHFNEWLAQFQAKETTDIPKEVYNAIKIELEKESYIDIKNLKKSKVRAILKKIGLNKYYEHVPHIINRISGKPAPIIDRQTEEKLRLMFKEIQPFWVKNCPDKRSNFLSYSYVLYKCLQLLELDIYLEHFSLLKSREKLADQDLIWNKICKDLKWEFIKTI